MLNFKQTLFANTKEKKPFFIMLVGQPCVGKSTFRKQLIDELKLRKIKYRTISTDDYIEQRRNAINQKHQLLIDIKKFSADAINQESNEVDTNFVKSTYQDVFVKYRNENEKEFADTILFSANDHNKIIILDRTFLTPERRQDALKLIGDNPILAIHFEITNQNEYRKLLFQRNETSDKKITDEVLQNLCKGATQPEKSEGFLDVIHCHAVDDVRWTDDFTNAISRIIQVYRNDKNVDKEQKMSHLKH